MKTFYIYPNTFGYLEKGAFLMWPGVLEPEGGLEDFESGEPVAICILGQPYDFQFRLLFPNRL